MKKVPFENRKTLYWVISDVCNYRCKYCFTRSKTPCQTDPLSIVEGIKKYFPGKWEIILSGGEPFFNKNFFEIVRRLVEADYQISIYSNFSAKQSDITRFLKITGKKLSKIFASLHLEYVSPKGFLEKIMAIRRNFPDLSEHLFVNTTIGDDLEKLKYIKRQFFDEGVQLILGPRINRDLHFHKYSKRDKAFLEVVNNIYNLPGNEDFAPACSSYGLNVPDVNFKGRNCPAGYQSAFMIPTGDIYGCLRACRAKKSYLGNILKGNLKLNDGSVKCCFDECSYPASYRQYFWCLKKK